MLAAMVVDCYCDGCGGYKDSNTPPLPMMMMIVKVDVAVLYLLVVAAVVFDYLVGVVELHYQLFILFHHRMLESVQ